MKKVESAATTTKSPSFQFYVRDYVADTIHLDLLEDLLYRRLLDQQWLHGSVPLDAQGIAKVARYTIAQAKKWWPAVEPYFPVNETDPTTRQNRRLERIREMQKKRALAGSYGGSKSHPKTEANAEQIPSKSQANDQAKSNLAVASAFAVASAKNYKHHITACEGFVSECPEPFQADVREALQDARDPGAMVRSLRAIENGMHPPAYPIAVIAAAIQELKAAGSSVTPAGVRGFARSIAKRDITAATDNYEAENAAKWRGQRAS